MGGVQKTLGFVSSSLAGCADPVTSIVTLKWVQGLVSTIHFTQQTISKISVIKQQGFPISHQPVGQQFGLGTAW